MNETVKHAYELLKNNLNKTITITADDELLQINCMSSGTVHKFNTCIAFMSDHDVIKCATVLPFKISKNKISTVCSFCNELKDIYCQIDENGILTMFCYVPYEEHTFEKYDYTSPVYNYNFIEEFWNNAETIYDIAYMINNDIPGFEDVINDKDVLFRTEKETELAQLINKYKSNPTKETYEKIKIFTAYVLGHVSDDKTNIECVSTNDQVCFFITELEAKDYIHREKLKAYRPMKCWLGKTFERSGIYFVNENVTINKEGENIWD